VYVFVVKLMPDFAYTSGHESNIGKVVIFAVNHWWY
jgi:hypothetical protein